MKVARQLLCALIALMLIVGPGMVTAVVAPEGDPITFEDEFLEAAIRLTLGQDITTESIKKLYVLKPYDDCDKIAGITKLDGLSQAVNLHTLYLNGNPGIDDITELQYLTNLKVLKLRDTNFQDLEPVVTLAQLPSRELHTLYLENSLVAKTPTDENYVDLNKIISAGVIVYPKSLDPNHVAVTGVTLSQSKLTLAVGETKKLTATIQPKEASNTKLHWGSTNTKVVKFENGKVTAIAKGTADIWVKTNDGHKKAFCTVTVTAPKTTPKPDPKPNPEPIAVTEVKLSHSEHAMYAGDVKKLTATVLPKDAANKSVAWASDNQDVATVDDQGKVTALTPGTAKITATTADGGKTVTCVFTVKEKQPPKLHYELKEKSNSMLIPRELLDLDENLEFKDGTLALYVPTAAWRGALILLDPDQDELTITVDQLQIDNPDKHKLIGSAYQFNLHAGDIRVHKFSDKLILEFKYDPQQVTNPDKLAVHWYNPETDQWDKLPSMVDANNKTVTTLIDHWSKFALLEEVPDKGVSTWVYYGAGVWLLSMVLTTAWMFKRR